MPDYDRPIDYEYKGIAAVLAQQRMRVPLYQREYAWTKDDVEQLFEDLAGPAAAKEPYFLGTIVLASNSEGVPEITDGQQRLATISILIAAIRDHLLGLHRDDNAQSIERQFLREFDWRVDEVVPRLRLNVDDHEFFERYVLSRPDTPDRTFKPTKDSHFLIRDAAELARRKVREFASLYGSAQATQLTAYLEFLTLGAQVMVLTVRENAAVDPYFMFDTLNNRGVHATKADLLKNHILRRAAPDGLVEAHQKWAEMQGTVEFVGGDAAVVNYLRHEMITRHGPTKERELLKTVRAEVTSKGTALALASELARDAHDYAALFSPGHAKWNAYGDTTRGHIEIIVEHLRLEQIRPLLFAISKHFSVEEAQKAFKLCVAWSVRFLIVGGRGGLLDTNYSQQAHNIGIGKVTKAKQLATNLASIIPKDAEFELAFATASVSKDYLARYYLRALEQTENQMPEWNPNENRQEVNLEHVLPRTPGPGWAGMSTDVAQAYHKRIGNMVLMQAKQNVKIGNGPFEDKRPVLGQSTYRLTRELKDVPKWDEQAIRDRQARLAKLAVKTWPI